MKTNKAGACLRWLGSSGTKQQTLAFHQENHTMWFFKPQKLENSSLGSLDGSKVGKSSTRCRSEMFVGVVSPHYTTYSRWTKYSNPAARTMLNPRTPKSQCFSARVSKSDVRGLICFVHWGECTSGYINIELWGRRGLYRIEGV